MILKVSPHPLPTFQCSKRGNEGSGDETTQGCTVDGRNKTRTWGNRLLIPVLFPLLPYQWQINGMSHVEFLDPGDLEKFPVNLSIQRKLTWFNLLPPTKAE